MRNAGSTRTRCGGRFSARSDRVAARASCLRCETRPRTGRFAPRRFTVPLDAIVLIAGELLLGHGLPFDYTVHLAVDSGARQRLTPPEWQWTLPAHDSYDREVQPAELADIIVRWNDPRHPAIRIVDQAPISPDNQQSMR